jgi:hypothetical protein
VLADPSRDEVPVVAQVRLAADERDLRRAHLGELPHDVERLVRGELVRARLAGARTAVAAGEIAAQRELPHRVDQTARL